MKKRLGLIFVVVPAIAFLALAPFERAGLITAQSIVAASAPGASREARPHPFEPTEELVYVGEFSRALLKKIDVADFRFTVNQEPSSPKIPDSGAENKSAQYLLKLTGDVSSKGFFAKLFNLRFREQIESTVEPTSFTVTKTKKVDEQGKRQRVSESTYADGRVVWVERDPNSPERGDRTASATFSGQVQDVLSAIYYVRTRPLTVGKTFEITISDSGNVYQVPVLVVEKKRKNTVLGKVEAVRIDPQLFGPNRILAGDGQFSIWLTNDHRRIPVSARIKLKYGTFDITLRKVIQKPAS